MVRRHPNLNCTVVTVLIQILLRSSTNANASSCVFLAHHRFNCIGRVHRARDVDSHRGALARARRVATIRGERSRRRASRRGCERCGARWGGWIKTLRSQIDARLGSVALSARRDAGANAGRRRWRGTPTSVRRLNAAAVNATEVLVREKNTSPSETRKTT